MQGIHWEATKKCFSNPDALGTDATRVDLRRGMFDCIPALEGSYQQLVHRDRSMIDPAFVDTYCKRFLNMFKPASTFKQLRCFAALARYRNVTNGRVYHHRLACAGS